MESLFILSESSLLALAAAAVILQPCSEQNSLCEEEMRPR